MTRSEYQDIDIFGGSLCNLPHGMTLGDMYNLEIGTGVSIDSSSWLLSKKIRLNASCTCYHLDKLHFYLLTELGRGAFYGTSELHGNRWLESLLTDQPRRALPGRKNFSSKKFCVAFLSQNIMWGGGWYHKISRRECVPRRRTVQCVSVERKSKRKCGEDTMWASATPVAQWPADII